MFSVPLTNWTTLRGATAVTTITQSEATYLDLRGFEDVVFWMEVKNTTAGGGTGVTIAYQTSPTKDESLFVNMIAAFALGVGVTITPIIFSSATVPLSRWVRFQLGSGAATGAWDATLRIWVAANVGPHQLRPRLAQPLPVRRNGKSCTGDCSKGGSAPEWPPMTQVGPSSTQISRQPPQFRQAPGRGPTMVPNVGYQPK